MISTYKSLPMCKLLCQHHIHSLTACLVHCVRSLKVAIGGTAHLRQFLYSCTALQTVLARLTACLPGISFPHVIVGKLAIPTQQ